MAGTTQRVAKKGIRPQVDDRASPACAGAQAGSEGCDAGGLRLSGLVHTIERDIIPRLVLAHRGGGAQALAPVADGGVALDGAQVGEFCALAIHHDVDTLLAYVRGVRERGVPLERVYLDLLAPAARRLGDMWLADECDFTTVTLSLWRLQRLLHELSPTFQSDGSAPDAEKRALFAAMPGEQHTFGLFMVAEFFRRAGWDVVEGPAHSAHELVAAVQHEWFAVTGFSLSCDGKAADLAALIRHVRQASRNRGMGIIVGGAAFSGRPQLVAEVGADGSAADGGVAVALAEGMFGQSGKSCSL